MAAEPPGSASPRAAILAAAVLVALALVVNARALQLRPSWGDNLYIVNWAHQTPVGSILAGDPDFYPEWRPLPYLTVWVQYRWLGLAHAWLFYLENVLLWAACAWLVWRLVFNATRSMPAGLFAGSLLLVDVRATPAVAWIIERQTTLACALGLLAWLVHEHGKGPAKVGHYDLQTPQASARGTVSSVVIWVLLLGSALSKEYGLAFAGALAFQAWQDRRKDRLAAALAAMASYAVLRFVAAGGAATSVCEESGFFFQVRTVCYDYADLTALTQIAYNLGASALDSLWPGIIGGRGEILVTPARLLVSAAWLGLAVLGWMQGSRTARIAAAVLFFNVVLNFMHYRDRNHLVSLCALGIAAGLGWPLARGWVEQAARARGAAALALLTASLLAVSAVQTMRVMNSEVSTLLAHDPCEAFADFRRLDPAFVRGVKLRYGMTNPDCNAAR